MFSYNSDFEDFDGLFGALHKVIGEKTIRQI